jgi:hypothetical protein
LQSFFLLFLQIIEIVGIMVVVEVFFFFFFLRVRSILDGSQVQTPEIRESLAKDTHVIEPLLPLVIGLSHLVQPWTIDVKVWSVAVGKRRHGKAISPEIAKRVAVERRRLSPYAVSFPRLGRRVLEHMKNAVSVHVRIQAVAPKWTPPFGPGRVVKVATRDLGLVP